MKDYRFGFLILVAAAFLLAGCPPAAPPPPPAATQEEEKPAEEQQAAVEEKKEEAREEQKVEEKVEEQKEEEEEEEEKEEMKEEMAMLDSSKLPPPRQPVEGAPDLHEAVFTITDDALERMKGDFVPDEVLEELEELKGQQFENAADFMDALRAAIGDDSLAEHRLAIARHSLETNLGVPPAFPGAALTMMAKQPESLTDSAFGRVFFDFDRSEIKPEFLDTITKNAAVLKEHPDVKVVVEGHCDERGTTEYNIALGERRAAAVRNELIAQGIEPSRLTTISFGEERPDDPGHDEAAWAKNRRSVIRLTQ